MPVAHAQAITMDNPPLPVGLDAELLTPEQIERRLKMAGLDQLQEQISQQNQADNVARLDGDTLVARIDGIERSDLTQNVDNGSDIPTKPLGQDAQINPADHIPAYEPSQAWLIQESQELAVENPDQAKESLMQKIYNKIFNDGVGKQPRLKVHLYQPVLDKQNQPILEKISRKQGHQEPYANIKAALEDITQESVADFKNALPRLRQTALAAARSVGYYDVDLSIKKKQAGEIEVVIERLGEPVQISHRIFEVRGEGSQHQDYQKVMQSQILQENQVFHHGHYEDSKAMIEGVSGEHGFFDGRWLDKSVDVILPDNVADVSLIYDTGSQYQFDQVVFFTIDPKTGQPTTDPDKLPVKPELLQRLLTFKMGDVYNRQAVKNLSDDLLATGYFNTVNTEVVYPQKQADQGQIVFEDRQSSDQEEGGLTVSETVDLGDGVLAEVSPLEFNASELLKDKLNQVAQKADLLYSLPENQLLPINTEDKNTSILGRISDAVSNLVQAILPDEDNDNDRPLVQPELETHKSPTQVHQDKKVPLYIFVSSDKPRDAHIGLGWGSDSGPRLVTKFEHNLINRDGYQAGAEVRLSKNNQGVRLYANKPLTHPLDDKLQASLSYDQESIDQSTGFQLSTRTLEQGISRNIINKDGWNRSYSLRYRLDALDTDAPREILEDLPVNFLGGRPTQEVLLAGVALHKTVADDLVNPKRGYRQHYSLELGAKNLVSDTNLAIARAGLSGVYSFGDNIYGESRAHQLSAGFQAGYIWASDFSDVPYKLRFFTGGDQSIRGYNHNSLSPVSDKGYLTGGQALAVANFEYSYEFLKDLRLAVFSDVGGAYDKNFSNPTKVGAGLGLRWASPVGQLRIDVATGVKEEGNPIKLHFFIGAPF